MTFPPSVHAFAFACHAYLFTCRAPAPLALGFTSLRVSTLGRFARDVVLGTLFISFGHRHEKGIILSDLRICLLSLRNIIVDDFSENARLSLACASSHVKDPKDLTSSVGGRGFQREKCQGLEVTTRQNPIQTVRKRTYRSTAQIVVPRLLCSLNEVVRCILYSCCVRNVNVGISSFVFMGMCTR